MNPHDKVLFHQKPPCTRLIRDRSIISILVFYLAGQLLCTAKLNFFAFYTIIWIKDNIRSPKRSHLGLLWCTSRTTICSQQLKFDTWILKSVKNSAQNYVIFKKQRWSIIKVPFCHAQLISFRFFAPWSFIRDRSLIRNPRVHVYHLFWRPTWGLALVYAH